MKNSVKRFVSEADNLFITAQEVGMSQALLLHYLTERVHNPMGQKSEKGRALFTQAERAYVQGFIAAKFDEITKNRTAYYYSIGGKLYASRLCDASEAIPHYYQSLGSSFVADARLGAIYWKGTNKVYGGQYEETKDVTCKQIVTKSQ